MKWTGPKDLKKQVMRLWERGVVLRSLIAEETVFPKRLVLKGPTSKDLTHAFTEVRAWCECLSRMPQVRFVSREVSHRVTGSNAYPVEAWLDKADHAVALLGKQREWKWFQGIVETTRERMPGLVPWLSRKPLVALEKAEEWERLIDFIDWLLAHPRPGCYIRQVDLPSIHTKFIEAHKGLLSELLDIVLPELAINPSTSGVQGFSRRYGFRDKPDRIRFRVLDPTVDPLGMSGKPDLTLDVETLAKLQVQPQYLFITENEINFLAFPDRANSWILFGAGYGFSAWNRVKWFRHCRIFYWGDIDTHGFAALDGLRGYFPSARSLLMDRDTLLAHRDFWGREPTPCTRSLDRLSAPELSLYEDLQNHRFENQLRLEQERISFHFLTKFLSEEKWS